MTFSRILVPLDGSRLAEAVLPAACSIAQKLGARRLLLHVLELDSPVTVHGEPHLRGLQEAAPISSRTLCHFAGAGSPSRSTSTNGR